MLKRLKQHWKVKNKELVLILCTFAITGFTTAWLSKKILRRLGLMKNGSKVSQWPADKASENNKKQQTWHLAIFASGKGSNAQKIIEYFRKSTHVKIDLIVCNKPGAGVLKIAENENIPVLMIEKKLFNASGYVGELKICHIDFIILAGFLWKLPSVLINAYPWKIINIHPALLPSYGGKGMYGNAVHAAVLEAKEKQSGITIHYVDDKYDHGEIIFQKSCPINENETVESLGQKVHELEHDYYPKQIEKLLVKFNY